MDYEIFSDNTDNLTTAILIKEGSLYHSQLLIHYINPLVALGVDPSTIVAVGLPQAGKKVSASDAKAALTKLNKGLDMLNIKTLIVAHGDYFKYLTKEKTIGKLYGQVCKCEFPGYENKKAILSVDYNALFYNDSLTFKLENSLHTYHQDLNGSFSSIKSIIHSAHYPKNCNEIKSALKDLLEYPELVCDVETFSLLFHQTGIATIAFAWDKHNGTAFNVSHCMTDDDGNTYDVTPRNYTKSVLKLLLDFFKKYKGKFYFYNALFDCKILINTLFINDADRLFSIVEGLQTFDTAEDVMLYTYLATNSTHETPLDLKSNTFEFTGNYAEDVKDNTKVPLQKLLTYNLKDCLATWYAKEKYEPIVVKDNQMEIYNDILRPSLKPLLYMMLVGMPIALSKVREVKKDLTKILLDAKSKLLDHPLVKKTEFVLRSQKVLEANETLKTKIRTMADFSDLVFNPGSGKQVQTLLYGVMDLPVIYYTKKKQPSTDAKAMEVALSYCKTDDQKEVIELIRTINGVAKILTTFITAFENFSHATDAWEWLSGNLKLGGTQSGRLSSNSPNMQNLPSNSKYGKTIKSCFIAPPGWLIGGADFSSLEDRINAILTKDPNKIKVYTDGYDGHCLRSFSYFGEQMPDIVDTVESINSIEYKYESLRQESKAPTFALTYLGTYITMMKNLGWSEEKAKKVEANYHKLYEVSGKWADAQIDHAMENGWVDCAFGLKLRTPLLKDTIKSENHIVYAASAEGRSAVNAVTQSWGLLINRALIDVVDRLIVSPHIRDIAPVNTIHDAGYFLIRDDAETIAWLNKNLVDAMEWNDHPKIQSSDVPMQADLTIGKSWDKQYKLKNNASMEEIEAVQEKIRNEQHESP